MSESRVIMDLNGAEKRHQSAGSGQQRKGATVSFHNIHYKVTQGGSCLCRKKGTIKDILIDLNGCMKPGLNTIMGATGSGKSSFLDVLAARKDPAGLTGEVLIDGAPQPPNFKCLSGYVVQDDVVMGTLTVRENFSFSAALRLPASVSQGEKEQRVDKLIQELGLGRVANSKVGTQLIRGISGGERKRTNIGMELIIDPSVLFLDEPTTGLDASTANSVLLLLKRMANNGRTIILSIHQPRYSIYRLFDSLTLLVNGKQVYHGPAQKALEYFSDIGYTCEPHNNPADFFLDIINGDSTAVTYSNIDNEDMDLDSNSVSMSRRGIEEKLVEEYRNCSYFKQTKAELERIIQGKPTATTATTRTITYNTGFMTQFRWVLKRTFRNLMLNPQTSIAQVAVTLFLALVVGAIFFNVKEDQSGMQNRFGALFFIVVNQCFSSLSSAELFISERKLFIHEYISGYYRLSVYFLCKILSDILTLRTIPAIVFSCVAYFMIGLKPTAEAFFLFMFSVTLVSYTATSMALAISADQTVVAIANIFMTIACVFMMIFAGLLVNLPSIVSWLAWLKYLSIPRYGLSALQVNEFTGLNLCRGINISSIPPGLTCTGEEFLEEQGVDYSTWGFWQNHMALGIMTISFLTIAYLKLRFIRKFT
ncbi:broad substrate specificity ATP-binding cassette transporter ABCG2-like isoform X1 [Micropterus dolomieu]|uniref:broad substrate specificity ATP-binding cassette transporter ABCG2-like isoform X1 n=1 Tax=Micropterus dolomieu TaxID=147949 RepID=UPI001E8DBDC9|nr:broad substrate specificity ATP-binding cassette transporter ABCG2-like isoform X1 [Micropterus dolomieu]XP_045920626.1 broad substrate specificity ATP-binding cassette transporter ABCG2-like isoform X1 [Micropterus dolomieu]XP_045920627.1 broad substrate specificity ATP-binding cassette transporter ABCG2-like isoform X1 [Micropterus dolomieu]XP_045920628.1 broad substrate specificity ATP-binding cassette transporter ABCG2-like isoform X1 [Micropterus dolomieu]XP_045920629.1 broad substrate 